MCIAYQSGSNTEIPWSSGNVSDAQIPHFQIHPQKGNVIRIFFDN